MMFDKNQLPLSVNSVLANPLFQNLLHTYPIKVIAPSSGICLKKLAQLRHLIPKTIDISIDCIDESIPFHANTDDKRFEQLRQALFDPSPQTIIWTLRGGYGSARLIDRLQRLPIPKQEKIVVGFSDITALHLFLSQCWHWHTIHGVGFSQLLNAECVPENYTKIAQIITKSIPTLIISDLKPLNNQARLSSTITGNLTGGNLTLVESSIGTCWQIQTTKKIVFLEEINEQGYRIDRSLHHLRQAGLLTDVAAIVLGDFTHKTEGRLNIDYALTRFAQETTIPIYQSNQFGHGLRNHPLIYNSLATISLANDDITYNLAMTL